MDLRDFYNEDAETKFESSKDVLVDLAVGALILRETKSYEEDGEKKLSVLVGSETCDLNCFIDCSLEDQADIAKKFNTRGITGFTALEFAAWNDRLEVIFILEN